MSAFRLAAIGILVLAAGVFGYRVIRSRQRAQQTRPAPASATQPPIPQIQDAGSQVPSAAKSAVASANHLGPFSIAGKDYTVEMETRKVRPGANDDSGDTVTAMEIRDAAGTVLYRRTFPYVEATADYFESWSASAQPLAGTNGVGLLINYGSYSEPSAPEEEPIEWFQILGVVNGKLIPFGGPLEIQGGLLDEYAGGHAYKAARPLGAHADAVEFKAWSGHCRFVYPVRVDWSEGKVTPAQECVKSAGALSAGCQYRILPEKLYTQGVTFVRLWPGPDEKSGPATKTVVKTDSKVELVTALVDTQWTQNKNGAGSADSKNPVPEASSLGISPDTDLWLKVRIDGKEGWIHSEEDFQALGLPEDE
jgi:hypothetical protein